MKTQFTSESVTSGHPDKLCDRIADTILDTILSADPAAHVAVEALATTDTLHIAGEVLVRPGVNVDYASVARGVIADVGYTEPGVGFDADSCRIQTDIHEQSPDIARGVNKTDVLNGGAGDQGLMFGYACRETMSYMPFPIEYAHRLTRRLEYVRRAGELPHLRPDGKAQLTVEYEDGMPRRIATVVVSAQHRAGISTDQLRDDILEHVIRPVLPGSMLDDETEYYINPTGRFVIGGPAGDTGLTGRKIICDTYGGYARHGGGSFSGKDPTKVDRSGAYMARYLAKNIVAADLAERCEVQLGYAIGLAEPVSLFIDDFGTGHVDNELLSAYIRENVDMRPMAIIRRFGLARPIYAAISCYGHFGENAQDMAWEKCDLSEQLKIWAGSLEKRHGVLTASHRKDHHDKVQRATA